MVSTFGNDIVSAFTGGISVKAIYTYGIEVWPNTEAGPYIKWTPADTMTGTFTIEGITYPFNQYFGYFDYASGPFYGVITANAFQSATRMKTLETNATVLKTYTFDSCIGLEKASLSKCSSVGAYAFNNCINLSSVYIPKCEYVGRRAFYLNRMLKSISLPEVSYISSSAFYGCSSLANIYIGSKCGEIGSYAFYDIDTYGQSPHINLRIDYFESLPTLGDNAFKKGLSTYQTITVPCNLYSYYKDWFGENTPWNWSTTHYCIGDGDYRVYSGSWCNENIAGAYWSCSTLITNAYLVGGFSSAQLETVSLSYCKTIQTSTFKDCTSLSDVYMPVVWNIGKDAFMGCTSLQSVVTPLIDSIYQGAFKNCTSLSYIMIGNSSSTSSSLCSLLSSDAFEGCTNLQAIYVKPGLITYYKNASNWSYYSDIITGW